MTVHSYSAARTPGKGSWTVTRSTTDGLADGVKAHFSFDDASVTSKLLLTELWRDTVHKLNADFVGVSAPAHLGSSPGVFEAFEEDDSSFDDSALFSDQGAGAHVTWQGTLVDDGAHAVVKSEDNAIGSADAALILASNIRTKLEAHGAIKAIARALNRDGMSASSPASYSTSGSSVE